MSLVHLLSDLSFCLWMMACCGAKGEVRRSLKKNHCDSLSGYHRTMRTTIFKLNSGFNALLTAVTACISGVLDSSATLTQLTSAPWAKASAMTGKFCRAAERYSSAPGWSPLRSSSSSSTSDRSRGLTFLFLLSTYYCSLFLPHVEAQFQRFNAVWHFSKCSILTVHVKHVVQACFCCQVRWVHQSMCVLSHLCESPYCSFGQGHWGSALREREGEPRLLIYPADRNST